MIFKNVFEAHSILNNTFKENQEYFLQAFYFVKS